MKVAAFQASLNSATMIETLDIIKKQVKRCEVEKVSILCCPETILGGLADNHEEPHQIALSAESGELSGILEPISSDSVVTIIGFTEIGKGHRLYNSTAVFQKGGVVGIYRKIHPAINRSVYDAGRSLPTFRVENLHFGIIICNDSNHFDLPRRLAAKGVAAIFIPTNNAIAPAKAKPEKVAGHARENDRAIAVENRVWVIRADVAGFQDGLASLGSSEIVDPNGMTMQSANPLVEGLVVAEIGAHLAVP